jgi:hypothetical protein
MIRTIAYKELLEMVRDGRFQWVAGILIVLLLTALAKTLIREYITAPMPSDLERFCLLLIRDSNRTLGLRCGWKPTRKTSSRPGRQTMPPPFNASAK